MRIGARARALAVAWLLWVPSPSEGAAPPRQVILDTDPGTDDALAILFALGSPELEVRALTVVAGNVPLAQGLENALKVLSEAGRCDVPVAAGAERPLLQEPVTAELWHGPDGLAGLDLPAPACRAEARFGPDLIVDLVRRHPGQITLLPVGPLTNIALAVRRDPSIVPLVKEVILMGGSISGGNATAAAEFNIHSDPEAARIVFAAGWPVTMVGLEVGDRLLFTRAHLARLRAGQGPRARLAAAVLGHNLAVSARFGQEGTPLYDPSAVGVAVDPTLVTTRRMRVDVETRGELTRGETVANRTNTVPRLVRRDGRQAVEGLEAVEPNASVCLEVESGRFLDLFTARLGGRP